MPAASAEARRWVQSFAALLTEVGRLVGHRCTSWVKPVLSTKISIFRSQKKGNRDRKQMM
jgi:hypothetical protein